MVEVANGRSLVWGAEAVQALRERLGVGGRTVGALPRGPRQNSRLGLPLLLMPEEARLLAEIGAVTLVSAPRPDPRQHSLVRGGPGTRTPWTCGSRLGVPAVGGLLGALDSGIVCMQDTRIPRFGLWGWEESRSWGSWLPKAGPTWILAFPPAYFLDSGILQTPARAGLPGAKRPGSGGP